MRNNDTVSLAFDPLLGGIQEQQEQAGRIGEAQQQTEEMDVEEAAL